MFQAFTWWHVAFQVKKKKNSIYLTHMHVACNLKEQVTPITTIGVIHEKIVKTTYDT